MKQPIHLYSSVNNQEVRATAERLADNLDAPVIVQDITELPAPDTQRPSRQQLRTERVGLQAQLDKAKSLLKLYEPHLALEQNVAALRNEIALIEARIQEIGQLMASREGGQADG